MGFAAFNRTRPQNLSTDAKNVTNLESFVAHKQVSAVNAVAGSNTAILAATALTLAAQIITANITNPATPRNIKIVGNAAGIAGNVVIKGTNINGDIITETIALNGVTAVEGNKAFYTVTEIDLPIQSAGSNTVSVGFGEKLGISYKLAYNTILFTFLNNVKEVTAPTLTVDSVYLENNTIKLNSSLAGTIVDVYFLV